MFISLLQATPRTSWLASPDHSLRSILSSPDHSLRGPEAIVITGMALKQGLDLAVVKQIVFFIRQGGPPGRALCGARWSAQRLEPLGSIDLDLGRSQPPASRLRGAGGGAIGGHTWRPSAEECLFLERGAARPCSGLLALR